MVAGNTKKVIVIKNISSNLIEEAILILKSEPDAQGYHRLQKEDRSKLNIKNDFILKEAESIINQYIKENGLSKIPDRHCRNRRRAPYINVSVNVLINILLAAAVALLIFVVCKAF